MKKIAITLRNDIKKHKKQRNVKYSDRSNIFLNNMCIYLKFTILLKFYCKDKNKIKIQKNKMNTKANNKVMLESIGHDRY